MSPGNRSKRRNRRACDGHSDGHSTTKATKPSGDKLTPTTADNEPRSKLAANKSLEPSTPNASVHIANGDDMTAVCWICAEPVKYYSLSACNHRTCHVCALRLRVLYEKLECTFCKEPQLTVIFTTSPDVDFLSYTPDAIPYKDAKLSIFFETEDMMEETLILLQFNCPGLDCDYTASGWGELKLHTRTVHGKVLCDLCIQFKKVFTHEHALYAPHVLPLHLPSIPHRPRKQPLNAAIECGIHPLCDFCNECFFGGDELFVHMRERHEECFLCKRNEIRDQYFLNYDSLELHFSQTHFACTDPVCQAEKFVVFDSKLDLNAHRLEVHAIDKNGKREARRLQVGFEFDDTGSGSRRGGRDCADPQGDHEAIPRTVQAQGSVPGRPRIAVEEYSMTESTRMRQRRASSSLAASVQTAIPRYRTNESSAHDLISTVWSVLDQNPHDTASIINAIVDFLEEGEKKHDLLSAWNEFKIDSEVPQRHQPFDLVPAATRSGIATGCLDAVHATASRHSEQSPRLDHPVALEPTSLSSSLSRPVPGASFPAIASSGSAQSKAFPSLIPPSINTNVTPVFHQSRRSKSWASVAALSASAWSSSLTAPKRTDGARQSPMLSGAQPQQSPSSAGPSTDVYVDANVAAEFYGNHPSQSPHTWASLVSSDLSAWTPNWNKRGGGGGGVISAGMGSGLETPMFAHVSEWSEVTVGQGKKGKGKQRQRLA